MTGVLRAPAEDAAGGGDGRNKNPAPRKQRRRRAPRLLVAVNVVLAVLLLAAGAVFAYVSVQTRRIKTVDFDNGDATLVRVPKGAPINILIVGSDSRAFVKSREEAKRFGRGAEVGGQRSDTMMVVRLDPREERAKVLSIPRDLYVELDGGGRNRINTAFANAKDSQKSDPARLVRTITKNLGLPIHHYVEVDFVGFKEAVDAIGGAPVYFPYPARDRYSGLDIAKAGCVTLNGDQALAYVRSRHYQYFAGGRWRDEGTGDIGRIQRQQDFLRRLLRKAVGAGLLNPVRSARLIEAGLDNVRMDEGLNDLGRLRTLAAQMRNLSEGNVEFLSLPGVPASISGMDVLRLDVPEADAVLAVFDARRPGATTTTGRPQTTVAPSSFPLVAISTGDAGAEAVSELAAAGYRVTSGPNRRRALQTTEIHYRPGSEGAARTVLAGLNGGGSLEVDRTVPPGQVVVLIGADWAGARTPGTPPPSTTVAPAGSPTTAPEAPKGSDPSVDCQ